MPDKKPAAPKEELRAPAQVQATLDAGLPPAEGAPPEVKGMSGKKIILMVVGLVVLLGGSGAGLYFSGTLDKLLNKKPAAAGDKTAGKSGAKDSKDGGKDGKDDASAASAFFLEIPNMLVNLSTTDGSARYLRLSVQLELNSDEDKKAVMAVLPRVVDQFQTYLRELRVKDLRGSAGIYRLQTELVARVNAAAYPVEVKDVLFQEILIQ
jgi:flagellar FliL protein